MKVSIIIPFYNRGETLGWTIRSAQNQTYQDLEIILVDDGSDEVASHIAQEVASTRFRQNESENVLEGWYSYSEESDNRVQVIKKKNGGLVSALNLAVNAKTVLPREKFHDGKYPERLICTGDLLLILDSDDWIDPTFVEKTVSWMGATVGIVSTDMHVFGPNSDAIVEAKPATFESIKEANTIPITSLFRRDVLNQMGGFKEGVYEDWALWHGILKRGWRHHVINEPLFHYRLNSSGSRVADLGRRHEDMVANMLKEDQ
jgi:glycosyltransferase involved in cell wall biosynthesis